MSKKDDKMMANLSKKIMSGNVKENSLRDFLLLCFRNSTLSKDANGEPKIVFSSELKEYTAGQYKVGEDYICINKSQIDNLNEIKYGSIWEILTTFGHETTHFKQYQRGDQPSNLLDITEDGASYVYDFMDLDKKGYIRDGFGDAIEYGNYLCRREEEEARRGGFYFAKETLEMLENNKYLKKHLQELFKYERMIFVEKERESERKYREYYIFVEGFKAICCGEAAFNRMVNVDKKIDDMNPPRYEDIRSMQVITDNRVGYLDSVDVAKDYVSLITEQCGFLQRSYIQSIDYGCRSKDKAFEIKQAIANYIINLNIDKNAQVEKCMDPLTAEFLEKEQVTNIYKYVLSNNIANADLLFFKRFLVIDKDNPRMLCKTLIDSYKKGNIKIENERDFNIFQDHLKYLSENHMKDLLPGMQKDLSDISKSFGIKGEIKQSTVSI